MNKRSHTSDPEASAKRPRLTELNEQEAAVISESRLINFDDPADPVAQAVSVLKEGNTIMI